MSEPQAFRDMVRDWLRSEEPVRDIAEVVSVNAYGTDWAGDTEGGFYSESDVYIRYKSSEGREHYASIKGEASQSLWAWIVKAWPGDTTGVS